MSLSNKIQCKVRILSKLTSSNDLEILSTKKCETFEKQINRQMIGNRWYGHSWAKSKSNLTRCVGETQMLLIMANSKDGQGQIFWYQ